MKIAIDKSCLDIVKNGNNEYIYLFDNEPLEKLLEIGLHCINYKYCDYVDINVSKYEVNCRKKADINEKN